MINEVKKHRCWYCPVCQTICELTQPQVNFSCQHCTTGRDVAMQPIAAPSLRLNVELLAYLEDVGSLIAGEYNESSPEHARNETMIDKLKDSA